MPSDYASLVQIRMRVLTEEIVTKESDVPLDCRGSSDWWETNLPSAIPKAVTDIWLESWIL